MLSQRASWGQAVEPFRALFLATHQLRQPKGFTERFEETREERDSYRCAQGTIGVEHVSHDRVTRVKAGGPGLVHTTLMVTVAFAGDGVAFTIAQA